jgi:hypothetical protein
MLIGLQPITIYSKFKLKTEWDILRMQDSLERQEKEDSECLEETNKSAQPVFSMRPNGKGRWILRRRVK